MSKIFSVIIPTLNSQSTLEICLSSVISQTIGRENIEILVVDGGSTDKTVEIAKEYGAIVLDNELFQQEYAKHIGIQKSTGKYLVFLDSDEVICSARTFEERLNFFEKYKNLKMILSGGYITPDNFNPINCYINLLGDPFSSYVYQLKNYKSFVELVENRYSGLVDGDLIILDKTKLSKDNSLLIDLNASNCVEKDSLVELLKGQLQDYTFVPKVFYLYSKSAYSIGVVRSQYVIHYSSATLGRYLSKLRWKVMVNVHYKEIPGTGFSNREEFLSGLRKLRKILFLPYSFSVLAPLIDGILLSMKHRKFVFLLHPFLTLYTAIMIVYHMILKLLGIRPKMIPYGKSASKFMK
ncbi:MAG: glycosyltransferase family 2 protein [Brevinematia bacterium]